MQKSPLIALVFTLASLHLFAQKDKATLTIKPLPDSAFIYSFDDDIEASLTYYTHNMQYSITDKYNTRFIYRPDEIYETDIGLSYSFISVSYTFSPKFANINNNEALKGTTIRDEFDIGISLPKVDISFDHIDVKGFYLYNTTDFDASWRPGKPYILFPGLHIKQTGGNITYNLNKHFSVQGLYGGSEQQLKTAFTFLPALYVYRFNIHDEDTLAKKGEDENTKNWDLNMCLPVAASFVFAKNWYCAINAGPCIGLNMLSSTVIDTQLKYVTQKQTVISTGYTCRLSLGWGNRKFFAGIDGSMRGYSHSAGDDVMGKRFYKACIYAGFRFKAPGFVKHGVNRIKKLLPVDLQ